MTASSSVSVQATGITYLQKLLTLARRLIDEGEYAIAVVVAQSLAPGHFPAPLRLTNFRHKHVRALRANAATRH